MFKFLILTLIFLSYSHNCIAQQLAGSTFLSFGTGESQTTKYLDYDYDLEKWNSKTENRSNGYGSIGGRMNFIFPFDHNNLGKGFGLGLSGQYYYFEKFRNRYVIIRPEFNYYPIYSIDYFHVVLTIASSVTFASKFVDTRGVNFEVGMRKYNFISNLGLDLSIGYDYLPSLDDKIYIMIGFGKTLWDSQE